MFIMPYTHRRPADYGLIRRSFRTIRPGAPILEARMVADNVRFAVA